MKTTKDQRDEWRFVAFHSGFSLDGNETTSILDDLDLALRKIAVLEEGLSAGAELIKYLPDCAENTYQPGSRAYAMQGTVMQVVATMRETLKKAKEMG